MADRSVGVLSMAGHPLLPYLLDQLAGLDDIQIIVVLDATPFKARDQDLFATRTRGAFPERSLDEHATLRVLEVANHNDPAVPALLADAGVSLLANGGTPRRLGAAILDAAPVVNAHPGLLPKYRGASCCEWAIHNDDSVGVSAHFMDEEYDSGPIILSEALAIQPGWTYVDVRVALYRLSQRTLRDAIQRVVDHGLLPADLKPQPDGFPVFSPIPADLFDDVVRKVDEGRYRPG